MDAGISFALCNIEIIEGDKLRYESLIVPYQFAEWMTERIFTTDTLYDSEKQEKKIIKRIINYKQIECGMPKIIQKEFENWKQETKCNVEGKNMIFSL